MSSSGVSPTLWSRNLHTTFSPRRPQRHRPGCLGRQAAGVRFLEEPYRLGDTRAVMIEGPSREALELVEVG